MSNVISQAIRIEYDRDPAEDILDEVGELADGIVVGGADVLVAVYKRVGKTRGGIIVTDRTSDEDDFQGVSALVLKLGPHAFKSEKTRNWFVDHNLNPCPPKPGDWILFDTKGNFSFKVGTRTCRLINDQYIMGILPRPDIVA